MMSKPDQATQPKRKAKHPAHKNRRPLRRRGGTRKRRSRNHKPVTADGGPRKTVIHHGRHCRANRPDPPGGSPRKEANRQRQGAEQLLAGAEISLKRAFWSHSETETARRDCSDSPIHGRRSDRRYRKAIFSEAHTLALKAYLLSDDLVKH